MTTFHIALLLVPSLDSESSESLTTLPKLGTMRKKENGAGIEMIDVHKANVLLLFQTTVISLCTQSTKVIALSTQSTKTCCSLGGDNSANDLIICLLNRLPSFAFSLSPPTHFLAFSGSCMHVPASPQEMGAYHSWLVQVFHQPSPDTNFHLPTSALSSWLLSNFTTPHLPAHHGSTSAGDRRRHHQSPFQRRHHPPI